MRRAGVALVGLTASGKSAVAMEVAERLGDVALLSVDSMTVYRHMDIGTGKPSPDDRARVPHFLLDLVDPADEFSVAEFQGFADHAVGEACAAGLRPLLVGGTGLYHRAVIDGLEMPGRFPEVVASLEERLEVEGLSELYAELNRLDPAAASKMEPTNARRVLRALEVTLGSGRPFSSFGPGLHAYREVETVQIGILADRDELGHRIARRVDHFMDLGLVQEVEALEARPRAMSKTARQAVGYKEVLEHLAGRTSLEEATSAIVQATRHLAKRQWAWFRRDPRIEWVPRRDAAQAVIAALGTASETGRMDP